MIGQGFSCGPLILQTHVRHGQLAPCSRHLAACGGVWLLEAFARPSAAAPAGQWLVAPRPLSEESGSAPIRYLLQNACSLGLCK